MEQINDAVDKLEVKDELSDDVLAVVKLNGVDKSDGNALAMVKYDENAHAMVKSHDNAHAKSKFGVMDEIHNAAHAVLKYAAEIWSGPIAEQRLREMRSDIPEEESDIAEVEAYHTKVTTALAKIENMSAAEVERHATARGQPIQKWSSAAYKQRLHKLEETLGDCIAVRKCRVVQLKRQLGIEEDASALLKERVEQDAGLLTAADKLGPLLKQYQIVQRVVDSLDDDVEKALDDITRLAEERDRANEAFRAEAHGRTEME